MQIVIHGIRNCDTMKKAFAWLDEAGLPWRFHDYRKNGVDVTALRRWCAALGWEALINRRGTTWRKLSAEQQAIAGEDEAIALMQAQPSLIRRPLVEYGDGGLLLGFDAERYAAALQEGAAR